MKNKNQSYDLICSIIGLVGFTYLAIMGVSKAIYFGIYAIDIRHVGNHLIFMAIAIGIFMIGFYWITQAYYSWTDIQFKQK